ncbi:MAG: hypothetical protein CFE23_15970 [Flavobacterium sp. BFFFF1]|uniref:hypothetical protein n=1 Tax=Flavobacterium sp. BFFFF1 TaxID=2015557 RepID=UPI000BCE780E|nr:hypothetical protein [Flavobacterium sp. BFFFF1]OYU79041.1 MAG: hypothetical protein CFE23_15970 [Flavobacterium sp. BFFFF1]
MRNFIYVCVDNPKIAATPMKLNSCIATFTLFFYCVAATAAMNSSRCSALFDIHRGFNAFKNITDYSIGFRPDLAYATIIYNQFPKGNESMKAASAFMMDYAVQTNHPPLDTIMAAESNANGHFLSYLSLCSRFIGDTKYWQYNATLHKIPSYESLYYETFIWEYAMRWDSRSIADDFETSAADFIKAYDSFQLKSKPLTESELMLYELFKMEIGFEITNDKAAFLSQLENLVVKHREHFSIRNYYKFLKEYFPEYKIKVQLPDTVNDGFETSRDAVNPLFANVKQEYETLGETVKALQNNPFDTSLFRYSNVERMIKGETFESILRYLAQLEDIEASCPKVCSVPANIFDFVKHILDAEDKRFTQTQLLAFKSLLLKKWADFHIACHITFAFYIDQIMIDYWNELPAKDQANLNAYFEKEFDRTDNHSYLLQMQKALPLKR